MTQEFDPAKSYLSLKAHEKMIAYVAFFIRLEDAAQPKEGVIKISCFHRPYGGGNLTLTFIVDTGSDPGMKAQLNELFGRLTEDALSPLLGREMERISRVSLDSLERVRHWYVQEISVFCRSLKGREKVLVEEKLLPALQAILPCSFEPVEWWPVGRPLKIPDPKELPAHTSLRELFRKWFTAE